MLDEARDGEAHRFGCSRDNESDIFYHEPTYFSLLFFYMLDHTSAFWGDRGYALWYFFTT